MRVANKEEMSRLYHDGKFGNHIATFPDLLELNRAVDRGYSEPVTLRYRGESGGKFCAYNVAPDELASTVVDWVRRGAEFGKIYANGYIQSDLITFQAEIQHGYRGYDIRYSTAALPMREALAFDQEHAHGLRALGILRHYLCPNSFADLEALFDIYPDSVVETTTVRGNIGVIPHRNTVFWEVRNY
jgi:hypothetical protein